MGRLGGQIPELYNWFYILLIIHGENIYIFSIFPYLWFYYQLVLSEGIKAPVPDAYILVCPAFTCSRMKKPLLDLHPTLSPKGVIPYVHSMFFVEF